MTYSVATDYVKRGIRCNCVCPGRVHTPFVDGYLKKNYPGKEAAKFKELAEYQPIGRMVRSRGVHMAVPWRSRGSEGQRLRSGRPVPHEGTSHSRPRALGFLGAAFAPHLHYSRPRSMPPHTPAHPLRPTSPCGRARQRRLRTPSYSSPRTKPRSSPARPTRWMAAWPVACDTTAHIHRGGAAAGCASSVVSTTS